MRNSLRRSQGVNRCVVRHVVDAQQQHNGRASTRILGDAAHRQMVIHRWRRRTGLVGALRGRAQGMCRTHIRLRQLQDVSSCAFSAAPRRRVFLRSVVRQELRPSWFRTGRVRRSLRTRWIVRGSRWTCRAHLAEETRRPFIGARRPRPAAVAIPELGRSQFLFVLHRRCRARTRHLRGALVCCLTELDLRCTVKTISRLWQL